MLAALYGIIVGLSLGLTGSGGSILAMPLMVYGLHIPASEAVILSLAVVGLIAMTGAVRQTISGNADWITAALFAATGAIISPLTLHFASDMPEQLRLTLFAVLMLLAAWKMVATARKASEEGPYLIPGKNAFFIIRALFFGGAAGALAGLFGIGGGFIIVPLLVIGLRMPFRRAIGTSLAIIFLISLSGVFYGVVGHPGLPWAIFPLFALGGVAGMLAGTHSASHLPENKVRKIFALTVTLLAAWILFDNLYLKEGTS